MTDLTRSPPRFQRMWKGTDKAILSLALILMAVAILDLPAFGPTVRDMLANLAATAPFIGVAVIAVGFVKASGAEALLARAFEGREVRMIILAAVIGGISPFCSCQVIPFIAALLAVGAPLSAVMAFWLASPLMDPAMFLITTSGLGLDFAIAKTIAAVTIGVAGGFITSGLAKNAFADPLKPRAAPSACATARFGKAPQWRFWTDADRTATFRATVWEQVFFLGKWLALAYALEALMIRYVPAEWIGQLLGGDGLGPVLLGALVGAPAYLNGYAAVPLVSGMIDQGMAPGAGMSFMIAGGMTCIPAAIAVWALVKPRVFAAYVGFAIAGAMASGLVWQAIT
ncbi:permease [Aliiroseovarius sp. PTFE2010]|uniref:permease n=1 Tax=Aliiroseovarius sp. PTFE2010 TaxID=3417190 RepID=UPI003CF0CFC7